MEIEHTAANKYTIRLNAGELLAIYRALETAPKLYSVGRGVRATVRPVAKAILDGLGVR